MAQNRKFVLKRRPMGMPVPEDFELITETLPDISEGEILVRNCLLYTSPSPRDRG